jgi:hypothetical protein
VAHRQVRHVLKANAYALVLLSKQHAQMVLLVVALMICVTLSALVDFTVSCKFAVQYTVVCVHALTTSSTTKSLLQSQQMLRCSLYSVV